MLILVNNSMAVVCRPAVLSTCLHLAYLIIQIVFRGGGRVLWGKEDRDDRRKS